MYGDVYLSVHMLMACQNTGDVADGRLMIYGLLYSRGVDGGGEQLEIILSCRINNKYCEAND